MWKRLLKLDRPLDGSEYEREVVDFGQKTKKTRRGRYYKDNKNTKNMRWRKVMGRGGLSGSDKDYIRRRSGDMSRKDWQGKDLGDLVEERVLGLTKERAEKIGAEFENDRYKFRAFAEISAPTFADYKERKGTLIFEIEEAEGEMAKNGLVLDTPDGKITQNLYVMYEHPTHRIGRKDRKKYMEGLRAFNKLTDEELFQILEDKI
tara:strand:- start:405 stop:1019 length:615 start_codon:yes stop_codon:yes gene_type:complete